MASIKSLSALTLETPPSCVEFVPGHPHLFVVGTYYLERNADGRGDAADPPSGQPQQRTGSLLLFRLDGHQVTLQHQVPTPFAIFDIHFAPPTHDDPLLLGAATSTGSLALYRIDCPAGPESPTIQTVSVLQLFPKASLITFFAWHPQVSGAAGLALSDGSVYLCSTAAAADAADEDPSEPDPSRCALLHAHDLEAWFVAFTAAADDGVGILTGGDDSALKYRSLPTPQATAAPGREPAASSQQQQLLLAAAVSASSPDGLATTQWQDRKSHFAGVTAILPLPGRGAGASNLVLTGSYDDHVRLLAVPSSSLSAVRRPAVLAELNLGGGVWRLKDITGSATGGSSQQQQQGQGKGQRSDEYIILASCMHAGARILRLGPSSSCAGEEEEGRQQQQQQQSLDWTFEVLAKFEEHQSMNYGSDLQPPLPCQRAGGVGEEGKESVEGSSSRRTVVSTSFYDRLLAVWTW